jgi:hypothetical protein
VCCRVLWVQCNPLHPVLHGNSLVSCWCHKHHDLCGMPGWVLRKQLRHSSVQPLCTWLVDTIHRESAVHNLPCWFVCSFPSQQRVRSLPAWDLHSNLGRV